MCNILQLRKYILDPNYAVVTKPIEVIEDLVHEEHPGQILNYRINQLRNKQNP